MDEKFFYSDSRKESLLNEIQKFPCLYDPQLAEYSNKISIVNAWKCVAKACGVEGQGNLYWQKWQMPTIFWMCGNSFSYRRARHSAGQVGRRCV